MKEEANLRSFVQDLDEESGLSRKRARKAQDPALDKAVFDWFTAQKAAGKPVSGPCIQTQALKFKSLEGQEEYSCSKGWIHRWKKRHGIKGVKICGEARSADIAAAEAFLPKLQEWVEEGSYSPEQIYNTDETGLNYKQMPDRPLAFKSDKTSTQGFKVAKEGHTSPNYQLDWKS